MKKKLIGLVLVLLLLGGVYWYWRSNGQKDVQFETALVARQDIEKSLALSGQISQANLLSVFTKASGVVSQVYVTDGQEVKMGDKLVEISLDSEGVNNQSAVWSSYLSAKNSLENAKVQQWSLESTMWQVHEAFEDRAIDSELSVDDPVYIQTERDWLAAEANYKNQSQKVAQAQAAVNNAWYNYRLYQATVVAPADGIIAGFNLAEGLTVSPSESSGGGAASQIVASISLGGSPLASFEVTEIDINQLKVGQEASLSLDVLLDQVFPGSVVAVDRVGSITNGVTQYPVLIKFDQESPQILTNMAVSAKIVFEKSQEALVVPAAAVRDRNGTRMVTIIEAGRPVPKQIETGVETDALVEVINGLEEGQTIVVNGAGTSSSSSMPQGAGGGIFGTVPGAGRVRGERFPH